MRNKSRFNAALLLCALPVILGTPSILRAAPPVTGDKKTDEPVKAKESAEKPTSAEAEKTDAAPPESYPATDIGIRMTPTIAKAISGRMTTQMKERYELGDEQGEKIKTAIERNIMKLAHDNATIGRDAIEMMMATMITNDGEFPRDAAIEFAKHMKPIIPALRQFFQDSAVDIGKSMTLKQRLRFTGDMTALTAGVGIFEARMKRWEAGEVADGANPFFDRNDVAEDEDADTDEPREIRRARRRVDRTMQWEINFETQWEQYVRNAILFYDFDESQQAAADGILEDCKARAAALKSDDWIRDYRQNRIADRLSRQIDSKFNNGPLKFQLETDHEKLMKPLNDLKRDLKRRIEKLPSTKQRAVARNTAEDALRKKGLDKLPL